jgi:hypothetical protein
VLHSNRRVPCPCQQRRRLRRSASGSLAMRTALCTLFLAAMAAEDSPLPAPTAEEGALLEFVNAHRCQRFAYDPIIIRMLPKFAPSGQFLASYIREYPYPQQALVANPKLAAAARERLRSGAAMPKLGPSGGADRALRLSGPPGTGDVRGSPSPARSGGYAQRHCLPSPRRVPG